MVIKVKEVLVKAYNSVGQVKRYYVLLRHAYEIIHDELEDKHIDKEMML
jgi:hypothetical protein